jgi:hypothetical protein
MSGDDQEDRRSGPQKTILKQQMISFGGNAGKS